MDEDDKPIVQSYDLGPLGRLLEITIPKNYGGAIETVASPIVILDISGSMGIWANASVTRAIPDALTQLGIPPRSHSDVFPIF